MEYNTSHSQRRARELMSFRGKWCNSDHEYGYGYDYNYGKDYKYSEQYINIYKALNPLIQQIKTYDDARLQLEKKGGYLPDLAKISSILEKEISLTSYYGKSKVALKNPQGIRSALRDFERTGLHLQIRQHYTGMPVYYLCRILDDYQSEYNLIVEDIYCSPGYPMADDRFVKLMERGHEQYFLRLSHFREDVKKRYQEKKVETPEWKIDETLYNMGRHVFQAAWHEDQRPGMLAAEHFGLTSFRQAIELLYLVLSGELCELRSQIDESMLNFFKVTYPQPALFSFLQKLKNLNGGELNELPKMALIHYPKLSKAFSSFLRVKVQWGNRKLKIPLNVLLLGNFSRLEHVGRILKNSPDITLEILNLEKEAESIIEQITRRKSPYSSKGGNPVQSSVLEKKNNVQ